MTHTLSSRGIVDVDYKNLIKHSPLAMYTCDEHGYINSFNPSAALLWERSPQIGVDRWCGSWKLYHTDGSPMPHDTCPMAIAIKEKKILEGIEIIVERPDHSFKNVLVYPQPLLDENDKLIGAFNTIIDITGNKTAKEKQAMLSALVESSDDAIISKNLNGVITSWNRGAQTMFGYSDDEIIGRNISVLIPPELMNEEELIIESIKKGKSIDHFQTERLSKSGSKINISLTVSPIKNDSGEIVGASKIARDITEQLEKQRTLKQNSQRLEILNSVGVSISGKLDESSILQLVTDATTQITGAAYGAFFYNCIDETGESYMLYALSGASRESFDKFGMPRNTGVFNQTFSGKGVVRVDDITKDPRYGKNKPHHGMPEGHLPVVSYLAVPVLNSMGTVFGGLFFGHPLPGVFTLEHEEIVKSIASQASVALDNSRLFKEVNTLSEKKDEFIALASHELKTPLTTMNGYLQILQSNVQDKTSQLFLERSLSQIKKLNALVADLFDISKVEAGRLQLNYEAFDIYGLLTEIIEMYDHSCTTHKVLLEYSGTECAVEADRQRIEQVIVNLVTNAIKYSPNTEKVLVSLIQSNSEVTVMVKDEGIGLSDDQQSKIFTRFYRADGNSNISGLGLGLYLSNEIVKRHYGKMYVKSKAGQGSEFYFLIPIKKTSE